MISGRGSDCCGRRVMSALAFTGLLALFGAMATGRAQSPPEVAVASPMQHLTIGFVDVEGDPRYEPIQAYDRIILKTREHPFAGAEVGIDEAAALSRVLKMDFVLQRMTVKSNDEVTPAVLKAADSGIRFFLLDAPAEVYKPLAAAVSGRDVLIFNVSTPDDGLRRDLCAREFVHVYPSSAQLMDGLVQYLVSRKWRDVLEFEGPLAADAAMTTAFEHSLKKFGARVVAHQHFKPGTDPRDREQNDPALLSAISRDYDVVFVADRRLRFCAGGTLPSGPAAAGGGQHRS